jgi:hypothetical protein
VFSIFSRHAPALRVATEAHRVLPSKRRTLRPVTPVEALEERVLPAVTLLIDYSLDNGFFNTAEKRAAIESAANEIGARLSDSLPAVARGERPITDPKTFAPTKWTFDVPANAVRIFVAGSALSGNTVGLGGWRTDTGLRSFDANNDFQPYVGYIGFDNDGSTSWNFSDTASGSQTNFMAVARHELLHVLGIGAASTGTTSWGARLSGGFFIGVATRVANGGVYPQVTSDRGHFAQGTNSIMAPVISSISHPTAVDWAALDDIGWDISTPAVPGQYADVVGQTASGDWWISTNLGSAGLLSPAIAGNWSPGAGWRDMQFGDVDGNGMTDVVGRAVDGTWWVGLNMGGRFQNRYFGAWNPQVTWKDVRIGDFDGDRRADIVGRTSTGAWYVARSIGTSFVTTPWTIWNEAAGWHDIEIGDFNGDGRDDIAARTSSGAWWIARSTGTLFATSSWAVWNEAAGWRDVLVADFDGNGKDDIAARTKSGEWFVGLSVGSAFSTGHWTSWNEAAGWRDVAVGDFFGDSRPDIIGRSSAGAWWVAASLGSSFSTVPYAFGIWTESAGWRDVQVGQFAGTGKADILARTAAGTWFVGENSGSSITFRPFGQWNEALVWKNVISGRDLRVAAAAAPIAAAASAVGDGTGSVLSAQSQMASSDAPAVSLNGSAAQTERPRFAGAADENDDMSFARASKPDAARLMARSMPTAAALLDDLFADRRLLSSLGI